MPPPCSVCVCASDALASVQRHVQTNFASANKPGQPAAFKATFSSRQVLSRAALLSFSGRSLQARKSNGCSSHRAALSVLAAAWSPPTVADTKRKFYENYKKPIPGVYAPVVLELLVQQHLMRYTKKYQYDKVFALGLVSVADQVLEGLPADARKPLFSAYASALDEDPDQYRRDCDDLEAWASSLSGPDQVKPDPEGDDNQKALAAIAARAASGDFLYTKFFAIGLFRLLELTGAKDPKALERLVKAMNVRPDSVNRDLMTYKGVLSKLSAAKELMAEYIEREKKKQAERAAEKEAKAEGKADGGEKKVAEETVDVSA